jgi:signal peptidase I, bacterial type
VKDFFKSERFRDILEWIIYLSFSILLAVFINKFIILNAHIPSGSMEQTIMTGDDLFVYRLPYLFSNPKRFDVVVFDYPDNEKLLYVKRIIALPGEKVEIKNGKVYINDSNEPLYEDFVNGQPLGDYGPYYVPDNCYFMMGDNRNNSQDSRFWHNKFVSKDKIVGKAIFRYSPSFKIIN